MDEYAIKIHRVLGIDEVIADVYKNGTLYERKPLRGDDDAQQVITLWWDAIVDSRGTGDATLDM